MIRRAPSAGLAVRVGAAVVWLVAGAAKAVNLTVFQGQVEQYRTMVRDVGLGLPSLVMALRPARLFSLDRSLLGLPDRFDFSASQHQRADTHPHLGGGRRSLA